MYDRYRQILKIYNRTKSKDIKLFCAIYLLGRGLR